MASEIFSVKIIKKLYLTGKCVFPCLLVLNKHSDFFWNKYDLQVKYILNLEKNTLTIDKN